MKGIVRHQSSARPEQFGASKVKKHRKKRGGPDSKPNKRYANTPRSALNALILAISFLTQVIEP